MHRGILAALLVTLAGGAAAIVYLGTASAGPPPPIVVNFTIPRHSPVAGRSFAGLAIASLSSTQWLSSIECDAEIGGKLLPARKQIFFPNLFKVARRQVVVCNWQIPSGTGGETLRLANGDHRAHVAASGSNYGSPQFSWKVQPSR